MTTSLKQSCDSMLNEATRGDMRVPGVVAMVTDRKANIYVGTAGERALGSGVAMTADSVMALFSTTKAITAAAVLQCVEEGLLDLDAPAKTYAPALGGIQVLEGFDDAGAPRLRAPKRDITTRMLLLHTAGFGYDIFNANYLRLVRECGRKPTSAASKASLSMPLLFEPGDAWEYGINIDWAGQVVEHIRGKRLGEVFNERIFAPLDITDMGFTLTPQMQARLVTMHTRNNDGSLTPRPEFLPNPEPEVDMGGGGLYGTVEGYMKFIRMWLNEGEGPSGRVLQPATVAMALRNGLKSHQQVRMLPGVISSLSNDAEFFPGLKKSWSYSFMVNDEQGPTGRPAGAVSWAGLANLFYWIDVRNGIGGFWGTQLLPFADRACLDGYMRFETECYRQL